MIYNNLDDFISYIYLRFTYYHVYSHRRVVNRHQTDDFSQKLDQTFTGAGLQNTTHVLALIKIIHNMKPLTIPLKCDFYSFGVVFLPRLFN